MDTNAAPSSERRSREARDDTARQRPARSASEVVVAAGVLGMGLLFGWATLGLPEAPGYSQVGPGVVPSIVSIGLIVVGTVLLLEALRDGLRDRPVPEGGVREAQPLGWVIAGLMLHTALIGIAGFVVASTVLFVCVARAFGSLRWVRDGVVAVVLACVLYWLFTQVLRLSLGPALGAFRL